MRGQNTSFSNEVFSELMSKCYCSMKLLQIFPNTASFPSLNLQYPTFLPQLLSNSLENLALESNNLGQGLEQALFDSHHHSTTRCKLKCLTLYNKVRGGLGELFLSQYHVFIITDPR